MTPAQRRVVRRCLSILSVLGAALMLGFAEVLRQPIEWLLALIDEYWIPGTVVLVTGVAIYQWCGQVALRARRA